MKFEDPAQFAAAVQSGRAAEAYAASPDELVRSHKALVRKIAWHVHGRTHARSELEDLMQIGLMALIEASRCYEDRGHSFTTYASLRIRGAMIDHLRREMPFRRSSLAAARQLDAARARLEQQWHRQPTGGELASELGLSAHEFLALEQRAVTGPPLSIDDANAPEELLAHLTQAGADSLVEQADLAAALELALTRLNQREQMVLQLYFHEELNLAEIGAVMDVTPARVCQIKAGALAKLGGELAEMTQLNASPSREE